MLICKPPMRDNWAAHRIVTRSHIACESRGRPSSSRLQRTNRFFVVGAEVMRLQGTTAVSTQPTARAHDHVPRKRQFDKQIGIRLQSRGTNDQQALKRFSVSLFAARLAVACAWTAPSCSRTAAQPAAPVFQHCSQRRLRCSHSHLQHSHSHWRAKL